ncbi:hypothetical protein HMPREF9565_00525 [Cutibacterium acnes HL053PA2]|nr:hypothetical protein HMPREF9598_00584 [Cutibacterium acnes HL050PA1]EFT51236.1 hypothetical protein HMPREF9565_00525 [Cutibacterium acnes HL053PA2]EGF04631.1 hypothetical protein HMPREF9586_00075 [Cutibacterium acnes HL083PA2]EGF71138.1 hypothetical protein HMPREF9588_01149 [Cutibacterium acnes HL025PA2]
MRQSRQVTIFVTSRHCARPWLRTGRHAKTPARARGQACQCCHRR